MENEPIINQYLRQMLSLGGSDLHLSINFPPKARIHGNIQCLTDEIITPEYIISTVAEHFDVTPEEIAGNKRNSKVVYPRQIAMYLCRELTDVPLKSIGKCLGNRDHTTIMHGCDKIEQELKSSENTRNTVEILKKKLQPGG